MKVLEHPVVPEHAVVVAVLVAAKVIKMVRVPR